MKKIIYMLWIILFAAAAPVFANKTAPLPVIINKSAENSEIIKLNVSKDKRSVLEKSWKILKGKPIDNSILIGMFSYHSMTHNGQYNGTNRLIGIDYNGYSAGTFRNSWRKTNLLCRNKQKNL